MTWNLFQLPSRRGQAVQLIFHCCQQGALATGIRMGFSFGTHCWMEHVQIWGFPEMGVPQMDGC